MSVYTVTEAVYILDSVSDPEWKKHGSVSFWATFNEEGVFVNLNAQLELALDEIVFNMELQRITNSDMSRRERLIALLELRTDRRFGHAIESLLNHILRV